MAYIKLEGIVDQPLGDVGFILLETARTFDGRTFDKIWKVWAIPAPQYGSFVDVIGEISAKINEYEIGGKTKRSIDLNINNAVIKILRAPEIASPNVNSDWATAPSNEQAPF